MADATPLALSQAEIDAIIGRLRSGELLDEHYRDVLFAATREAQIVYDGKEPRGSILARTMAVPLQTLKRYGEPQHGWTNKLIFGDNLQVLKTLWELKRRGELRNADGSHGVRLCYIDPPFATRREFRSSKGQKAYRDKIVGAEFIEFLRKRLVFIHELLSDTGVFYLHLDTRKVHYVKVLLDEVFGEEHFRNEVVWQRTNARSAENHWPRVHDTILVYSKGPSFILRPLLAPADRAKMPHTLITGPDGLKYQTFELTAPGRTKAGQSGRPWKGVELPDDRHWANDHATMEDWDARGLIHWPRNGGFPRRRAEEPFDEASRTVTVGDVWTDIDRINQAAKERLGYPTQKPLGLLERIISASSDPGDVVLDCFGGSGTTAVAAEQLERRWIVVDCGKLAIYASQQRLFSMTDGKGKARRPREPRPFDLCTAGLYDNSLIEKLPFEKFGAFALELFGCRPHPHSVGGVPMHGLRQGGPVHLFPFDQTDALMGVEYVDSLHDRIAGKVSGSVYVIAPVACCDPGLFEDMIVRGDVTFFILRVPYSVIAALHERDFQLLVQPSGLDEVNDALDSFGFDFMEVPEAEVGYVRRDQLLEARIKSFRRGGLDPDDFAELDDAGRADLAFVMVDHAYDGGVFRISSYHFAEELRTREWTYQVPLTDASTRLLAIYTDTHGNELRQIVSLDEVPKQ